TAADTYYVYVPYGNGGYISSERIVVTNIADPCSKVIGITQINTYIPEKFRLYQNYPNPFNPVTTIRFDLPASSSSSMVKLIVYDITGREIAILYNGEYKAGQFETLWDASNLPSGVYYYRLTDGNFNDVKKMVIVK
ncbi:MAG TPA: T9SS type A sorting domain-containing protein, partial [Ignavibacteria bacterium]|nr:T9SS type A sorting domain-containing protein [Ignavibacteria bacterium]